MRIWCKFCDGITDRVNIFDRDAMDKVIKVNKLGAFVVHCRRCNKHWLIKRKTHGVIGTVYRVKDGAKVMFVADEGELIIGKERLL